MLFYLNLDIQKYTRLNKKYQEYMKLVASEISRILCAIIDETIDKLNKNDKMIANRITVLKI